MVRLQESLAGLGETISLNTSYVMVRQEAVKLGCELFVMFKYIICYGSATNDINNLKAELTFKYIICYGSAVEHFE